VPFADDVAAVAAARIRVAGQLEVCTRARRFPRRRARDGGRRERGERDRARLL
jgi:hypothetical protein